MEEEFITTGQAMTMCSLSRQIVIQWFDNKFITGYRKGPRQDRMINKQGFVDFLKKNNIPYRSLY